MKYFVDVILTFWIEADSKEEAYFIAKEKTEKIQPDSYEIGKVEECDRKY